MILWRPEWGDYPFPCHLFGDTKVVMPLFLGDIEDIMKKQEILERNFIAYPPGSAIAVDMGCKCPVFDNHHGKGFRVSSDGETALFWLSENCPLHIRENLQVETGYKG